MRETNKKTWAFHIYLEISFNFEASSSYKNLIWNVNFCIVNDSVEKAQTPGFSSYELNKFYPSFKNRSIKPWTMRNKIKKSRRGKKVMQKPVRSVRRKIFHLLFLNNKKASEKEAVWMWNYIKRDFLSFLDFLLLLLLLWINLCILPFGNSSQKRTNAWRW